MNETIQSNRLSDVPWPTSDHRMQVPAESMMPDIEKAATAPVGPLEQAVQSAHDTIDRFADSAAPTVQQLDDSVLAAEDALHAKADQLVEKRDEWVEGVRATVRGNPLVALAAAVTLGVVIARVAR